MRSISVALRADGVSMPRAVAIGPARVHDDRCPLPASRLDYAIIESRTGFDALAAEWDALFQRAGRGTQLFQSHGWCWHWCNHYLRSANGRTSLAIVTGRQKGRLALVWPMVATRRLGVVQLTSMGDPVSQYSDALVEPSTHVLHQLEEAWQHLLDAVKPDLVWLAHVRADAAIAPIMPRLGCLVAQREKAPFVDLASASDIEALLRRQSVQLRKKHRAAVRRLAKAGPVTFADLADGGTEAGELAAAAIDMKRGQLSERGILSPTFTDARLRRFFTDAAHGRGHQTGARVLALDSNGERAAADILVACKDCIATHVIAYDPRFAKDSVGWQLLYHAIGKAYAEGYRTFDLMAPADDYKLRWADGCVDVIDWVLPVTRKGAIFARLYPMLARPLLKRIARSMPQELRRRIARRCYSRAG